MLLGQILTIVLLTALLGIPRDAAWGAPPSLPGALVDTTYVPPTGRTIAVAAGGDVQAALHAAQPGDVITLEPGATFRGPFVLPNKTGTGWITVRSGAPDASLPPQGTRVNLAHAGAMPKIVVGADEGAAIKSAAGAHHFRFIGVEVHPLPRAFVYSLIELGSGDETSLAALPSSIIFDRCYIHGDPDVGGRRGIALNGRALAVIDSRLADFKEEGADSQAIAGWSGPGPFKIANNYLEAAGENVIFGGEDPRISNLVPADIEILRNHFVKPLAWRGSAWTVKNLFELKNARRVLVEGNVLEHSWLADQAGFAVFLTVRNQYGRARWSTIEDVTFRKNLVRHAASGINILGTDDVFRSQTMQRVLIRDNLFDDISGTAWGGRGQLFQILDYRVGTRDLVIEHNTGFSDGAVIAAEGVAHRGFVFRNNLTARGEAGVFGTDTAEGIATLTRFFPRAEFQRNIVAGADASIYPADNFLPASLDEVGFVGGSVGNYRLAASSLYKSAGTDGRDVGADIDALEAAIAGVIDGTPGGGSDTTAPSVALTAPTSGATVSGAAVTVSATASDDVGVARVQFRLDDAPLGAPVTAPPYAITWDTTTATSGRHTLTAHAFDAAGNTATSVPVTVTVTNDTPPPPGQLRVILTSPPEGATVSGQVTVNVWVEGQSGGANTFTLTADGDSLGTTITGGTHAWFVWDTSQVGDGAHTLTATVRDATGQTGTASRSVTVANATTARRRGHDKPRRATSGGGSSPGS